MRKYWRHLKTAILPAKCSWELRMQFHMYLIQAEDRVFKRTRFGSNSCKWKVVNEMVRKNMWIPVESNINIGTLWHNILPTPNRPVRKFPNHYGRWLPLPSAATAPHGKEVPGNFPGSLVPSGPYSTQKTRGQQNGSAKIEWHSTNHRTLPNLAYHTLIFTFGPVLLQSLASSSSRHPKWHEEAHLSQGNHLPMVLLYLATGGTRFNHWCSTSRLVLLSQLLYLDSPKVKGDFVPLWKSLLKLSTPVPAYTWLEGGEYAWSLKGMNTAPSYSKCFDSLLPRIYKALHRCLLTKLGKPLRFFKVPCPQLPRIGW